MDVHIHGSVTKALRERSVDILTAQEDGADELEDPPLLLRATELGCVLVTQDDDFLAIAPLFLQSGLTFNGVIYSHQQKITLRQMIEDLELIAKLSESGDLIDQVEYLPWSR